MGIVVKVVDGINGKVVGFVGKVGDDIKGKGAGIDAKGKLVGAEFDIGGATTGVKIGAATGVERSGVERGEGETTGDKLDILCSGKT